MEGTILNLIEGRPGTVGTFKGRLFRINAVSEDEIQGAIGHLGWHDGIVAIS